MNRFTRHLRRERVQPQERQERPVPLQERPEPLQEYQRASVPEHLRLLRACRRRA